MSYAFVVLALTLGQAHGILEKVSKNSAVPGKPSSNAMTDNSMAVEHDGAPVQRVAVSLTESEAQFESRIAIGASVGASEVGKAETVAVGDLVECNWRENPNCWTDRVWDYLKNQDKQDTQACLSKELEGKRSLDGLLDLVNEAANITAAQNTTLHKALANIWTAILNRQNSETKFRDEMQACNDTQEERRRNELLPFYMELQELAHIANPTYRSAVEHSDAENMATPEAEAADAAIAASQVSFIEMQSEVDSGSSITDFSRLQTSSLQNAGQEACHKFASLVETHKELSHIHQPGLCKIDGNRTRIDLERNFTYAYLAIAGLYDQKHQEIANETYTCVENALQQIRDITNQSNAMINKSMEEIFASRAIITVLVPILQDLDLAELNLWQAGDVMNDTCHEEYNSACSEEENTKYGGDVMDGPYGPSPFSVRTVKLCSGVCTNTAGCTAYTFDTSSLNCTLLSGNRSNHTSVTDPSHVSGDRCEGGAGRPTTMRMANEDYFMEVIREDIENLGPCAGENTFVLENKTWQPSTGWWDGALVPDMVYPIDADRFIHGIHHRYPPVQRGEPFNMEFNITHGHPDVGYTLGYGIPGYPNPTDKSPIDLYRKYVSGDWETA